MAEIVSGIIERIMFHDPENGFAVLRVQADGRRGLVAVVGYLAVPRSARPYGFFAGPSRGTMTPGTSIFFARSLSFARSPEISSLNSSSYLISSLPWSA